MSEFVPKIIDISLTITPDTASYPGKVPLKRNIQMEIAKGAPANCSSFEIDCHFGTHVDSPNHFAGDGITIDQLSLSRLCGNCCVIEVSGRRNIEASDLTSVQLGDRVLFKTLGSDLLVRGEKKPAAYAYLTPDAAKMLVSLNANAVGIDAFSVDDFEVGEPVHHILLPAGIPIIECLNLSDVEPSRYELTVLPLKIQGAEASPARAILRTIAETDGK